MSTGTELAVRREENFMPVLSIEKAVDRRNIMVEYVQKILKKDTDFGVIPGTGNKPTLLKAGAEKLNTLFGLSPKFSIVERTEDWTGGAHGGQPFFYYYYKCSLYRGDVLMADGDGSCNSFEAKYRWRKGERKCPSCGAAAIIKGKAEYGGGYVCFGKKGGCGAKFKDGDQSIESQDVGRVANPDAADQVNTIQKMAQKRALVGATLIAVNASEFFTQDVEDMGFIDGGTQDAPAAARQDDEPVIQMNADGSPDLSHLPTFFAEFDRSVKTRPGLTIAGARAWLAAREAETGVTIEEYHPKKRANFLNKLLDGGYDAAIKGEAAPATVPPASTSAPQQAPAGGGSPAAPVAPQTVAAPIEVTAEATTDECKSWTNFISCAIYAGEVSTPPVPEEAVMASLDKAALVVGKKGKEAEIPVTTRQGWLTSMRAGRWDWESGKMRAA